MAEPDVRRHGGCSKIFSRASPSSLPAGSHRRTSPRRFASSGLTPLTSLVELKSGRGKRISKRCGGLLTMRGKRPAKNAVAIAHFANTIKPRINFPHARSHFVHGGGPCRLGVGYGTGGCHECAGANRPPSGPCIEEKLASRFTHLAGRGRRGQANYFRSCH